MSGVHGNPSNNVPEGEEHAQLSCLKSYTMNVCIPATAYCTDLVLQYRLAVSGRTMACIPRNVLRVEHEVSRIAWDASWHDEPWSSNANPDFDGHKGWIHGSIGVSYTVQ